LSGDHHMGLLAVRGLHKQFGGVHAVSNVSFDVARGTIKAIIGPNGAGKTTIFNLLTGLDVPTGGSVFLEGQDITSYPPYKITNLGLARTFQNIRIFNDMTVLENVMVGRHTRSKSEFLASILKLPWVLAEEREIEEQALHLLEQVGLEDKAHELARNLTYGHQRRLEIARALATQPKALLLDEPAAGLNTSETAQLALTIEGVRQSGITVLLIDHRMGLVMNISDEVLVLNFGQVIAEGTPKEIQSNEQVIEAYLGKEDDYSPHN